MRCISNKRNSTYGFYEFLLFWHGSIVKKWELCRRVISERRHALFCSIRRTIFIPVGGKHFRYIIFWILCKIFFGAKFLNDLYIKLDSENFRICKRKLAVRISLMKFLTFQLRKNCLVSYINKMHKTIYFTNIFWLLVRCIGSQRISSSGAFAPTCVGFHDAQYRTKNDIGLVNDFF